MAEDIEGILRQDLDDIDASHRRIVSSEFPGRPMPDEQLDTPVTGEQQKRSLDGRTAIQGGHIALMGDELSQAHTRHYIDRSK